jgi:hypothetical protein
VLLYGEQFAGPADSLAVKVPISGALVDAMQLARMISTAVVLGCEQAGSIHLQAGRVPSNISRPNQKCSVAAVESGIPSLRHHGPRRESSVTSPHRATLAARLSPAVWGGLDSCQDPGPAGLASRKLISAAPDFSTVGVAPALASLPMEETTEPLKSLFSEVSGAAPTHLGGPAERHRDWY